MNDPQPEGHIGKLHRTTKILSHAARRRGGSVAARGARAADGDPGGRVPERKSVERRVPKAEYLYPGLRLISN